MLGDLGEPVGYRSERYPCVRNFGVAWDLLLGVVFKVALCRTSKAYRLDFIIFEFCVVSKGGCRSVSMTKEDNEISTFSYAAIVLAV